MVRSGFEVAPPSAADGASPNFHGVFPSGSFVLTAYPRVRRDTRLEWGLVMADQPARAAVVASCEDAIFQLILLTY